MGGELPRLHPDDQGEVLVLVDLETPADEPLLTALGRSQPVAAFPYGHVRYSLGRKRVVEESRESDWQIEVLRLHQLRRYR
ncbi:hypothetical protein GCM10010348_34130 [Streptomyces anthocyanicus]|nr:hypothetical protein GCM10010348_34130 [Streptomyces anthocyanicus]